MEARPARSVSGPKTESGIVGSHAGKGQHGQPSQSAPEERNEADLPEEFKSELHGTRIVLDIGDLAEGAAGLVNLVRITVGQRWQTPTSVRDRQVLMIERVQEVPAKLEVSRFGQVELLGERSVHVPEPGRADLRQPRARRSQEVRPRIVGVIVGRERRIASECRLKSGWVHPLGDSLCLAPISGEVRIPDQIAPEC